MLDSHGTQQGTRTGNRRNLKLTLSLKRLKERRPGMRRERTPEELTLGHRRADRRPNTQIDILVGTAWFTGASHKG